MLKIFGEKLDFADLRGLVPDNVTNYLEIFTGIFDAFDKGDK